MGFIKNYIKTIIREVISEESIKPNFDKIKLKEIKTHNKKNVYTIIENMSHIEITLLIEYIDIDTGVTLSNRINFDSADQLYKHIMTFKPQHQYFTGIHLSAKVVKEGFGSMNVTDVILNSLDNKIYESKDFDVVFSPLVKWMKERPHLIL